MKEEVPSMLRSLFISLAWLAAAAPAAAMDSPDTSAARETRIPRISHFLEWVADGQQGIFVRAESGRWYYARTRFRCSRLRPTVSLGFIAPSGELDRFGALSVEGWRCPLISVVASEAPPGHENR